MTYVLDTHTLLWFLQDRRIGSNVALALED